MHVTAKVDYAVRAMVELAQRGGSARADELAEAHAREQCGDDERLDDIATRRGALLPHPACSARVDLKVSASWA